MIVESWSLYPERLGVNQIRRDQFILSWAAKEWNRDGIYYQDLRHDNPIDLDRPLLDGLWNILDQADIIVGHNVKKFDVKMAFARFLVHGMSRPSPFLTIDTLSILKKHFKFPSNSLDYATSRLCPHMAKTKSRKFIGGELQTECERGNMEAWREMERYNKQDVRATEALWNVLEPYDNSINFNLWTDDPSSRDCKCGGTFVKNGTGLAGQKMVQRYICNNCRSPAQTTQNLIPKEKRKSILRRV